LSNFIPIGFNFNFYGDDFYKLAVSPNGFLTFDTTSAPDEENSSSFSNTISLFEQEHEVSPWISGTIKYTTIGTVPNRKFVLSYDSVYVGLANNADSTYSTGQIVLYETTNVIEMYIAYAKPIYSGMLQEIASRNGSAGLPIRMDSIQHWTATNNGERFTPDFDTTHYNIPYPALASICEVTVDSASGKNMVVWNKSFAGIAVDSFIIYKETNISNNYEPIGAQLYSVYSTFIDTASNPAQQANRYELGFRDSCGFLSALSAEQKTIHLSISQGIGNTWNLQWDAYEGLSYNSFNIYRGTTPSDMTLLTSVASSLYSYTDLHPPTGPVYYVIGIDVAGGCNPTARTSSSFSSTLSNVVTNNVTGVPSLIDESSINIFPNPTNEIVTIKLKLNAKTDLGIVIDDITGRIVYSNLYKDASDFFQQQIDCSSLSRGVYFVELKTDAGIYNRKIIVE
jgi:hypothetical protein